jgi:hypothetical protein
MAQSTKTVFTWASVAKGKPQTTEACEAERIEKIKKDQAEKDERERIQSEREDAARARQEAATMAKMSREQQLLYSIQLEGIEYARKYSKENGWIAGNWPKIMEAYRLPKLTVPRNVNERARDWVEKALSDWWPVWIKCTTVVSLREAFINAFVPYCCFDNERGANDSSYWEKKNCPDLDPGVIRTNAELYANLSQWVVEMEADKLNPPYRNIFWVQCKNITFENCLWAMNVLSSAFKATDKDGNVVSGFLSIGDTATVQWVVDFENYIPLLHQPKEKCRQAKEEQARKDKEWEDDDMY